MPRKREKLKRKIFHSFLSLDLLLLGLLGVLF